MGNDKNYVSVWVWLLAIIAMGIPGVNLLVAFIGSFLGDNDSRKNFFRAQLLLLLIGLILVLLGVAIGILPAMVNALLEWFRQTFPALNE